MRTPKEILYDESHAPNSGYHGVLDSATINLLMKVVEARDQEWVAYLTNKTLNQPYEATEPMYWDDLLPRVMDCPITKTGNPHDLHEQSREICMGCWVANLRLF